MKILFVTCAYPAGKEKILQDLNRGIPLAIQANTFQWGIMEGLEKNQADYQVVSYPSLSCFPLHYKKPITPAWDITIGEKRVGCMEPFLNIHLMAHCSIGKRIYRYAKRWVEENLAEEKLVILVYSLSSWILKSLLRVKKQYPQIRICTIVTDLPKDVIVHMKAPSAIRVWAQMREAHKIECAYPLIDKFVLLTAQMEKMIPQAVGKNLVLEGIWAEHEEPVVAKDGKLKTLLYSGSLGRHSCVDELLKAFELTTDPDYRLVICGSGELEPMVKEAALKDERIVFNGFVARTEVLEMQKNATAVINPRTPSVRLTQYSFPSKTIEYMTSGTPYIGHKLSGIPQEYYPYFYAIEDNTPESMARTIESVFSKTQEELNAKAHAAYEFIQKNKRAQVQVGRLLDFLR